MPVRLMRRYISKDIQPKLAMVECSTLYTYWERKTEIGKCLANMIQFFQKTIWILKWENLKFRCVHFDWQCYKLLDYSRKILCFLPNCSKVLAMESLVRMEFLGGIFNKNCWEKLSIFSNTAIYAVYTNLSNFPF